MFSLQQESASLTESLLSTSTQLNAWDFAVIETAVAHPTGHNSVAFGQHLDDAGDLLRYRARFGGAPRKPPQEIDFDAKDERDAKRRLRVMLASPVLPLDLELICLSALDEEKAERRQQRTRFLLRAFADHFQWLKGSGGERAELPDLDLSEIALEGRDLSQANFRGADLSGASLQKSRLSGANFSGAVLRGADLRGADLSGADLSNADLRGAVLIGAKLEGVDTWRANFAGAVIAPECLHQILGCKRQLERI